MKRAYYRIGKGPDRAYFRTENACDPGPYRTSWPPSEGVNDGEASDRASKVQSRPARWL
jgi:hypothetical protein